MRAEAEPTVGSGFFNHVFKGRHSPMLGWIADPSTTPIGLFRRRLNARPGLLAGIAGRLPAQQWGLVDLGPTPRRIG